MTARDDEHFAVSASDLLRWGETLAGVARTGLGFTESLYERERFEEVLKVAADIRAAAVEEAESDALFEEWLDSIGEGVAGYVTPKVAVGAPRSRSSSSGSPGHASITTARGTRRPA